MNRGRVSIKFADDRRKEERCGECNKHRERDREEERCERRHEHRERDREEERCERRHEHRERDRDEERFEERHEHRRRDRDEERFEERHEHRRRDRDEERFEERHEHREHEKETILECGHGTGSGPLPINRCFEGRNKDRVFRPIVLATVVLDKKRLLEPTVKIDFSSLISFRTSGEDFFLNIMFRLSKICREEERIPLGTWTFEESQLDKRWKTRENSDRSVQETESFCFTFCEEDEDRDRHCRYIVEIIDLQSNNIDFAIVSNVSLTALAVGHKRR